MFRLRTLARRSAESRDTSCPLSQYLPEVGRSSSPRIFINVDLPEPDTPISATISPCWIVKRNSLEHRHVDFAE